MSTQDIIDNLEKVRLELVGDGYQYDIYPLRGIDESQRDQILQFVEETVEQGATLETGGDTVAALNKAAAADGFTYVSSAGGAFLEWMEGKDLPGVAALKG